MHRNKVRNSLRSLSAAALAAVILMGSASAGGASQIAHKAKRLSLATVSFGGAPVNQDFDSYWAAISKGYFKQQGLNVTLLPAIPGSPSSILAVLAAGAAGFVVSSPQAAVDGDETQPVFRQLLSTDVGGNDEIAITQGVATADNIPAASQTASQAIRQIEALKGSHLSIGYSTVASTSYADLLAVLQRYGISYGAGGDVSLISTGSATTLQSGLSANKFQAIINNPPTTVIANTIVINLRKLAPVSYISTFGLTTTVSMIQKHSDTVQAFVNAVLQGWQYTKAHPADAVRIATPGFVSGGITSPEEIQYLVQIDLNDRATSPLISRVAFSADVLTANIASNPSGTVTYGDFVDNSFATKAIKTLGLKV